MSFSQCGSAQKIQNKSPLVLKDVYYKEWSNPARGTGSGINLYISSNTNKEKILLDSIYFRRMRAKLMHTNDSNYVGRFKTKTNERVEYMMSSDVKEEYGNAVPKKSKPFPFELENNECVVSYIEGNKIKYFKISKVFKRQVKRSSGESIRQ